MYLTVWRDELEEVLDRLGYEVRVHVTEGELLLSNGTDVDAVDCVHHSKPFSCSFQADFSMLKDLPRGNPFCARDLVVLLADSNGVRGILHAQWGFHIGDEAVLLTE
jgi:hypothetical protein